jgi:hypothetical protein
MDATQDWVNEVTDDLLRAAQFKPEGPLELPSMREKVRGALGRLVPPSQTRLIQGRDASSILLVLHGTALYRAAITLGTDATVGVERIDLIRRVTKMALTERHWDDGGRPMLDSRWHLELEGGGSLEIPESQLAPYESGRLGEAYKFGQAVARAAGWESP